MSYAIGWPEDSGFAMGSGVINIVLNAPSVEYGKAGIFSCNRVLTLDAGILSTLTILCLIRSRVYMAALQQRE